jgi:hypothetical protein
VTPSEDGAPPPEPGDPDKIRLRTDAELAVQADGLHRISAALTSVGLPHFLSGGTLLGAVREGDFIRWDWDVEVSVRTEEVLPLLEEAAAAIRAAGLTIVAIDDTERNLKIVAHLSGAVFEVRGYRLVGDARQRNDFRTLDRFFREATSIEFRGRTYACLGPTDDYLTDRYGSWRTPVRSAVKSQYLSENYFIRSAGRRRAIALVGAVLRRVLGRR